MKSYDEFNKIWRHVLRQDPYKLEAEKFRVQLLAKELNHDTTEIKKHLDVILDYIPDGDWSNNIFAGVAYFLIGDKDDGIACVEPNVDFGFETEFSGIILNEMKAGKLDAFTLFALKDDLQAALEKTQPKQTSGKRRDLTRDEIKSITRKYNFVGWNKQMNEEDQRTYGVPKDKHVISHWIWPGFTIYTMFFL